MYGKNIQPFPVHCWMVVSSGFLRRYMRHHAAARGHPAPLSGTTPGHGGCAHGNSALGILTYLWESVKWAGHQHTMGSPTNCLVLTMKAAATSKPVV